MSYDHGWTHFSANEEIGVINPANLMVGPTGLIVEEPASGVQSVKLTASNSYLGVYALDSLDRHRCAHLHGRRALQFRDRSASTILRGTAAERKLEIQPRQSDGRRDL